MAPDPVAGTPIDGGRAGPRGPFAGRETQLGALLSAVQAADFGERVLALVAGEPGIGKTRLVAEVAARVSARTLWATCWDGDGVPAYWPWRQVVRELTPEGDPDLREADAVLLQRAPAAQPGMDARFRMFDAVATGLAATSRTQPLLIVLDDLHWADEASVRLLQFIVRDTRQRRLAIIGTYRDTDLDPAHPLAGALAGLAREGLHVSLGGLGRREVGALIDAAGVAGPERAALVPMLHRRSGGNPFFLWELLHLLRTEGALDGLPDGPALDGPGLAVPTGVQAVVTRRLSGLSAATSAILAAAAVLGADFEVPILGPVTGVAGSQVLAALHEAQAAGVLVPATGGGFGFVHALVREVLYAGLSPEVRVALHRKVARVLEHRYGDARPAELAHHVLQAAVDGHDDEGVDYAVRAAERSLELLGYEEAAHWYGRAIDVLRGRHPRDAREGALLLRCGEARLASGDLAGARAVYQQAAAIARRNHDAELLARAALGLGAGLGGFEVGLLDPVQVELLEEALDALGPQPSRLRAWVLARLSVALSFMEAETRRRSLSEQAVAVAREAGDSSALGYALAAHCDSISGPDGCGARLTGSAEIIAVGLATRDRQLELLGRRLRMVVLLELGDIGEADAELERFARVAERLRQPLYRWYVPLWRGMRALMRGEVDQAARHCAKAEEIGVMAGSGNAAALTFTQAWVRQRYQGRFAEGGSELASLLEHESMAPRVDARLRAVVATQLGEHDKAAVLLQQWLAVGPPAPAQDSEWLPECAQLALVATTVGAVEPAEVLYTLLRPYAHLFCVEGIGAAFTGSVAWYLALLTRFLGRVAEADGYQAQADAAHRRVGLLGDPPALGNAVGPAPPAAPATPELVVEVPTSMVWEGHTWAITYAAKTCRLRDSKGLRDLAILLARPQQEVHCLELVGGADVGSTAGAVLDQQARRAYEQRIRDLQEDIDEARDFGDSARAERAEAELDTLVQQLAEAFGLSGRARSTGSAVERARSAVGWRIRAALRHTAEVHPELARHLGNAVRTGTWCSYRPEVAVSWHISLGQGRRA